MKRINKSMRSKRKAAVAKGEVPKTSIYLNGRLVGFHENGTALISELRSRRRQGSLSPEVNFQYNRKTDDLFINSDSGRARIP